MSLATCFSSLVSYYHIEMLHNIFKKNVVVIQFLNKMMFYEYEPLIIENNKIFMKYKQSFKLELINRRMEELLSIMLIYIQNEHNLSI